MKKYLLAKQKRLEEQRQSLLKRSQESQDVEEVRAINSQLMDIANELHDIADALADIADDGEDEEPADEGTASRSSVPAQAQLVNGEIRGQFPQAKEEGDYYASLEYRKAFM